MFNDKELCKDGTTIRQGALINFVCSKTNERCKYCRYCTHDRVYKMLYTSTICDLKQLNK